MPKLTLILDTREQDGLDFSKFRDVDVVRQGLKTGDYSIQCYEDRICFERKSVQDLVGTLIGGHDRFLREMERMRDFEARYILVEHSPTLLYSYCQKRHRLSDVFSISAYYFKNLCFRSRCICLSTALLHYKANH